MPVNDGLTKVSYRMAVAVTAGQVLKASAAVDGVPGATLATSATAAPLIGVAFESYAAGQMGAVVTRGVFSSCIAGATLTPGTDNYLTVDGSSRVVAATAGASDKYLIGRLYKGFRDDATAHVNEAVFVDIAPGILPAANA